LRAIYVLIKAEIGVIGVDLWHTSFVPRNGRWRALPLVGLGLVGGLTVAALATLVVSRGQSRVEQFIETVVALSGAVSSLMALLLPRLRRVVSGVITPTVPGLSVAVPSGRLPKVVRGRDGLMKQLRLMRRAASPGLAILAGAGGAGKSTVAAAFTSRCQQRSSIRAPRYVWWVSAADPSGLTGGLVTVASQLGASLADLEAIGAGSHDGPDRLWALLRGCRRRWLLVFDNADDPCVLGRPSGSGPLGQSSSPADGTGWARAARRGLVVVTTRDRDPATWGRDAQILAVEPLDEADAALVLLDYAPQAGDEQSARLLARRLGGMPLPLQLAGSNLASTASLRRSFHDYARSLDDSDPERRHRLLTMAPAIGAVPDPRSVVMRTWEISLDDLARRGIPHARPLLRLLSCFAPATPIPWQILDIQCLQSLLGSRSTARQTVTGAAAEHRVEDALHKLSALSLIDISPFGGTGRDQRSIVIHPVVADTNRGHLNAGNDHGVHPRLVRQAAVELLLVYLGTPDDDRIGDWPEAADWPKYMALGPHLHSLLDTVAPSADGAHLRGLIRVATQLASAFNARGLTPESERLSRAAIGWAPVLGDDDPAILRARHHLAWSVADRGNYADAETMQRDVSAGFRRVLGDDHPDTITTLNELAWIAACRGRWAEAEMTYRKVLDARRRTLGESNPQTLITWHELGWTIASQDREDEAESILRDVLEVRNRVIGERHLRTLMTRRELAWIAARRGRLIEAEASYREIIQHCRETLGQAHPKTLMAMHELAWVLAMRRKRWAARRQYRRVLRFRVQTLGADHPDTNATRDALTSLKKGEIFVPGHRVLCGNGGQPALEMRKQERCAAWEQDPEKRRNSGLNLPLPTHDDVIRIEHAVDQSRQACGRQPRVRVVLCIKPPHLQHPGGAVKHVAATDKGISVNPDCHTSAACRHARQLFQRQYTGHRSRRARERDPRHRL
jgi:tetratricopeptide (TPR) repeat protein